MNSVEKVNLFMQNLIISGKVQSQKDFGQKLGYKNESSFSQLLKKEEVSSRFLDKILEVFPEYENFETLLWENDIPKQNKEMEENLMLVPVLPVSAMAGSLAGFSASVETEGIEKIISPILGIDYAITVTGDSMYPEYPSGSKVLIKKINEKAFIEWGNVYVLDTCNGVIIKKVTPCEDPKKIKCSSINVEYDPFEVFFADIYGMYKVLLCLSFK